MKTLLSELDNLWICSLIDKILLLFPIISNEWNNLLLKFLFSFFKLKFSTARLIKFNNLFLSNGFWINSKAPDLREFTAISIFAWPDIIITGISLFFFLIWSRSWIPSLSPLSNLTSMIATSGNFLSISESAWLKLAASLVLYPASLISSSKIVLISELSSIMRISEDILIIC